MTEHPGLPKTISVARGIAFFIAFVVGLINLILSFFTLRNLAVRSDIPVELAWMWPVGIDGTILVATLGVVAIGSDPSRRSDRRYFWTLLVSSAAVSIGFNIVHAILPGSGPLPMLLNAVIAATAPITVLLTTHALVVLGRQPATTPSPQSDTDTAEQNRHNRRHDAHDDDAEGPNDSAAKDITSMTQDDTINLRQYARWHDMAAAVINRASMQGHDQIVVAQALHLSYDRAWPQRQVGDELKMSHNTVGKIVNTCAQLMREGQIIVEEAS